MNKISAEFDYEIVKKAVRLHYQCSGIDFDKIDRSPDKYSREVYLDYFSKIMKKYGLVDDSVKIVT